MSENIKVHVNHAVAQNTGNPVLDSLVNLYMNQQYYDLNSLRACHSILLELAEKEPSGLKRQSIALVE